MWRTSSWWVVWLLVLATSLGAAAGAKDLASPLPKVSSGSIVRLDGLSFKAIDPRPVDVWLPEGYPDHAPYAVLYQHDGQMLFDASQTWNQQEWQVDEIAGALQRDGVVRPFIVVGIHNRADDRHAEYLPQRAFERLDAKQRELQLAQMRTPEQPLYRGPVRSDRYLRWLVKELMPVVSARFEVSSHRTDTAIMGSSMGGLISWYALERYPKVFGQAACLSTHWPGGFPAGENLLDDALLAEFAAGLPRPGQHRFWFDHGTETLDQYYPALQQQADAILRDRGFGPSDWVTRVYPGSNHSEQAWSARLADPLLFLFGQARD